MYVADQSTSQKSFEQIIPIVHCFSYTAYQSRKVDIENIIKVILPGYTQFESIMNDKKVFFLINKDNVGNTYAK